MNRKGFTLVELISTFALASVIIVLLMNVVILIKDIYNQNNVKTELMIEQSNLSKIMNEEFNKGVVGYEWCNDGYLCYNFSLSDGTSAHLKIDNDLSKITFNNYVYKVDKGVEIKKPEMMREFVDINDDTNTDNFMRIKIPIVSKLYPNKDFGIDLVFEGIAPKVSENESSVCTIANGETLVVGQKGLKYNCKVNDETTYTFFTLSYNEDGSTNLIMDRNIYYDVATDTSEEANEEKKGTVEWISSIDYGDWGCEGPKCARAHKGPITAMTYLYNATKDWSNIPNIVMNYIDEGNTGKYGYGSIITTDNITKITMKDGTVVKVLDNKDGYPNLKARLPKVSEMRDAGCNISTTCPLYLVNYLNKGYRSKGEGEQNITGIYGYWLLSSYVDWSGDAHLVDFLHGYVDVKDVYDGVDYGVRPVITVDLNPGE